MLYVPTWKNNNKFNKYVPLKVRLDLYHYVYKIFQHTWYRHVEGSMAKKLNSPFFAYVTYESIFGWKITTILANVFCIWCYSGSYGELLFCRCACALLVFYISIVFDNDGQLRMMNKWMMAENEFERLDDTTSPFTYIQSDKNRSTYHMKYLPHWHSFFCIPQ